jgi:acyl-CoA synthetase (AMP-forming)/AMP-acid ligase II
VNLASNLVHSGSTHADRVALRLGDAATTYQELDRDSARVAGLLRDRGMQPGDRVRIMLPNTPEIAVGYYGVLRAGGVVIPMNPLVIVSEARWVGRISDQELLPSYRLWSKVRSLALSDPATATAPSSAPEPPSVARLARPAAEDRTSSWILPEHCM